MLTKTTMNDKIEVLNLSAGYPVIQVRQATIIAEDGVEISRNYHRRVITLGDDFLAETDHDIAGIIQCCFTAEAQAAWAAAQAAE